MVVDDAYSNRSACRFSHTGHARCCDLFALVQCWRSWRSVTLIYSGRVSKTHSDNQISVIFNYKVSPFLIMMWGNTVEVVPVYKVGVSACSAKFRVDWIGGLVCEGMG